MSIGVDWYDDAHTIIMVRYERLWTWADFAQAKVQIDSLLNSVAHTVNIISDSRESGGLPGGNAMNMLARSFQSAPDNIENVLVIGANPFFKALLQILKTISLNRAAQNIHFFNSLDDALSMLRAPI